MLIEHAEYAPEGSTFSRFAFDASLGKALPLKLNDKVVGEATLIGAIPATDRRSVTLTWEVDMLDSTIVARMQDAPDSIRFDDFIPEDAFNPASAIARARRAMGERDE